MTGPVERGSRSSRGAVKRDEGVKGRERENVREKRGTFTLFSF